MRKQELIIFIGAIVLMALMFLIYLLTSLFSSPKKQSLPQPSPRPTSSIRPFSQFPETSISPPTPLPLPTSLPIIPTEKTKESLISLMPVQTDFVNIEYLSTSDSFAVTIKKDPYKENRAKVEEWFRNAGFNPSTLNIYWQTYPEVTTN